MTFLVHGVLGAGVCSLPFRWSRPWIRWAATAFGAVGGLAPDVADWIAAVVFGAPRWVLYSRMHSGDLVPYFIWHPSYALHLWLDSFIHIYPNYNWWGDFYWLEIGAWLLGAAFLWAAFGRKE